jgi:hypothetical protein
MEPEKRFISVVEPTDLTDPKLIGYIAEEVVRTDALEHVDGIYASDVEGLVIASAVSIMTKKPIITREAIEMLKVETVEEHIELVFLTFSLKDYDEIANEIKYIRSKGIKLDTVISITKVLEDDQKKLRILGIKCIVV